MSSDSTIQVRGVSKAYYLYERPEDRLKQAVVPRLYRLYHRLRWGIQKPAPQFFHEFWALRDVGFEVGRGEAIGIIGRNGSGKSTLLQIICGTVAPTVGEVETKGRIAALLELGAGFNPEFSGRENVKLLGSVYGISAEHMADKLAAIIDFAEIGEYIDQPVRTYSSGMFVRLAFATIAHIDADVLVVDEALAVGDAFFQQKCWRFLRSFRERGTLLFVSHDIGAVRTLCSRVVWLESGKVEAEGPAKEVCDRYFAFSYAAWSGQRTLPPGDGSSSDATPESIMADTAAPAMMKWDVNSFGDGKAVVTKTTLSDASGAVVATVAPGATVQVKIETACRVDIHGLILGFIVKDRLGQLLFGDNTSVRTGGPLYTRGGDRATATFSFRLPELAAGHYVISAAVASGTVDCHIQHHWVHEATQFTIERSRAMGTAFYIPMMEVDVNVEPQVAVGELRSG